MLDGKKKPLDVWKRIKTRCCNSCCGDKKSKSEKYKADSEVEDDSKNDTLDKDKKQGELKLEVNEEQGGSIEDVKGPLKDVKDPDPESTPKLNKKDKALYIFGLDSSFRKLMTKIAWSKHFDHFILVVIAISSIALAFENPLNDPEGTIAKILYYLDITTTVIFISELLIKVIAAGFAFNGPKSYIRSFWHSLDFLIVIVSIFSLINLPQLNISFLKVIRMARLLRPLKIISKNENLKMSINALVVSIPAIGSLMVIVLLFMCIFAIMGVSLFKGKSWYCDTEGINGLTPREIET